MVSRELRRIVGQPPCLRRPHLDRGQPGFSQYFGGSDEHIGRMSVSASRFQCSVGARGIAGSGQGLRAQQMHLLRAQALARTGDAPGADRALKTARAHRHPAYVFVTPTEILAEAWLAAIQMRTTEARRLANDAAEFARDHHQLAREVWCLQTAVQFDDTEAAGRLTELATLVQGPRAAIAARYATALSTDQADGLAAVSLQFEVMGDLLTAADAAGQAATWYRRQGRAGSAMTSAASAKRLATLCGGATSPAITAAPVAPPFANREREIAALVAQGLSNRQIAESVSLSVRTVESHIYRAGNKAGVLAGLASQP